MVSDTRKEKLFFDIIKSQNITYQRKGASLMNISISQNFKNVLKNKIKILISPILYKSIDFIVDNLFEINNPDKYFYFMNTIQSSVKELIKNIVITAFEELDNNFKNSNNRTSRYIINKSNVSRTIITIVGEITFSRTYYINKFSGDKFFYVDNCFDLPKYDHYDPIIKAIAINNAVNTSQAQSARDTSAFIGNISHLMDYSIINNIPRQSIFNWINSWNVPDVIPESIDTPDTLYIMADEKYIGAQDIDKDIMVKSFVAFEDVKTVGKNRRSLVNRFVFSCYDTHAWPLFLDAITKRYDFTKIKNIALLADGGNWIKAGIHELYIDSNNHVKFYLCEFHFKQAIHHITSDDAERKNLIDIFSTQKKKDFINAVNTIIENNPNRKDTITKKLNYILNNYSSIKAMLELKIGSSMESHISHLIASFFSSRPKGFSTKRIKQYLKLNDYKNNNINIFKLYMQSYRNTEIKKINEEIINNYTFDNNSNGNIPVLNDGLITPTYEILNELAH